MQEKLSTEDFQHLALKVNSDIVAKKDEDPLLKFLDIIQKMAILSRDFQSSKNDYAKYIIDLFYQNIIANQEQKGLSIKIELNKVFPH